ncbi:MAG: hypothetical protein H7288_07265 [Kineosporiaceae bacterium]|nr:hypothetical protein [Aeromicrobium sp.]
MASPQSDALARSYRASQIAMADRAAAIIAAFWRTQMGGVVDRSAADRWLDLSVPVLARARRQSAMLGQGYYKADRRLNNPGSATISLPPVPALDPKILTTSLWVTGAQPYVDAERSVDDILSPERINQITGAVARQTMSGGREAVDTARQVDPIAFGYYRETDGDPCYFCAVLASRGVVYKDDSFDESDPRFEGEGKAKVHDECACFNRPAYDRSNRFPGATQDYNDKWLELTGVDSKGRPIDPIKEFRQRFENRY